MEVEVEGEAIMGEDVEVEAVVGEVVMDEAVEVYPVVGEAVECDNVEGENVKGEDIKCEAGEAEQGAGIDMEWFDNFLDREADGITSCHVNDFDAYIYEMEGECNVEWAFSYPNKGVAGEKLGSIKEEISSYEESEDNEALCDDSELPPMHPYEQECEDDDAVDEDDDDVEGPVMFNKYRHLQTLALIPNIIFANFEEFRSLIREYALVTRRDVKLPINEKNCVQAVCRVNCCPFKVACSKNGSEQNMSIKSISGSHSCGHVIKNKQVIIK
ncbi:hypothetical protein LIER_09434 [Lithospermum erythrorhizon]|uniref:Transposase MuDR plant domain-containing protein n=1 Tax=Lithospermum erythrorhizon TaxID=34254 RepID=A0AAV3PKJ4_LITER